MRSRPVWMLPTCTAHNSSCMPQCRCPNVSFPLIIFVCSSSASSMRPCVACATAACLYISMRASLLPFSERGSCKSTNALSKRTFLPRTPYPLSNPEFFVD
ncbi:hypothetical protein Micbo1qcDRAFT_5364 [Microdochium bolleyi]|uniref:Uncharacterized protein n=1 Tax=Microdochium bolleyi TaxID=196109 RepID=A0A136JIY0_9PEZI|nr:hypothetical protein Micbo1qcDRAFT_5364 [Microdochium bolleyi]